MTSSARRLALVPLMVAIAMLAAACSSTSSSTSTSTSSSGPPSSAPAGSLPTTGSAPGSVPGGSGTSGGDAPGGGKTTSAGCGKTPAIAPGTIERTMTSEGVERKFQLIVPKSYDGTKALPIVFGLHALTVGYQIVPSMTGFGEMAPSYDFIGVAPSGRVAGATPYWNAAPAAENYDLDFFEELLDLLESDLCVDPSKVFSTGMSNGAQMSSLLACRMSDRITAVAPVAGVEFFDTCKGRPVPVIAFHGTTDPIVGYDGSGLNATTIANQQFYKGTLPEGMPVHHGVDAAMTAWAAHNGCDPEPVEDKVSNEVRRRTWQHCKAPTILYMVDGGGHAWPGKPVPAFEKQFGHGTTEIDATKLIFDFFFTS